MFELNIKILGKSSPPPPSSEKARFLKTLFHVLAECAAAVESIFDLVDAGFVVLQILLNYPPSCSKPAAPNLASLDLARQNDYPGLLLWGDHRSLYLSVAKLNDVAIRC